MQNEEYSMGIGGRRFSLLLGMIGVGLIQHEPAEAQTQQCEALLHAYSKTEIVDALVKVGDAWMTLAGSAQKPEMLGKADTRYINAKTVCDDLTRAQVSPSQLAEELRRRRHARDEMERWRVEYRQQMLGQIAEVPAGRPEPVDTPRSPTLQ
jgi:hypothetical protein